MALTFKIPQTRLTNLVCIVVNLRPLEIAIAAGVDDPRQSAGMRCICAGGWRSYARPFFLYFDGDSQ